jgi:hypothetical protein
MRIFLKLSPSFSLKTYHFQPLLWFHLPLYPFFFALLAFSVFLACFTFRFVAVLFIIPIAVRVSIPIPAVLACLWEQAISPFSRNSSKLP